MVDVAPEDDEPVAIDGVITRIVNALRSRDRAIGQLARLVLETHAWRAFGYTSFDHYVHERLGMSRAALSAKMALARRCEALPELGAALDAGRIGVAGAALVGRVADTGTAAAWIERASERTVKHLREEIEAAGLVARTSGGQVTPPEAATLAAVQDFERAVLAGEPAPAPIQMSVGAGGGPRSAGRVPLRVTVAADIADLWMAVRAMFERRGEERSFVAALSDNILRYWTPQPATAGSGERPFEAVYRRDRYRCASPACDRREVGAHHVVFRAFGGGDEADNLITLCGRCHVEGVHAGHVGLVGRAPDTLSWSLGGVLMVDGRVRR